MKKIITMLMLILSTLSFAAKKLYVGTNAEFKPYEYLENNKIATAPPCNNSTRHWRNHCLSKTRFARFQTTSLTPPDMVQKAAEELAQTESE